MAGIIAHRLDTKVISTKPRASTAPWIHRAPNEQWVEDHIGAESLAAFRAASAEKSGLHGRPIPILGTGAFLYGGDLHHPVADEGGGRNTGLAGILSTHIETTVRAMVIRQYLASVAEQLPEDVRSFFGKVLDVFERIAIKNRSMATMGFASLSDLISEMTTGAKAQQIFYTKTGIAGIAGRCATLWYAAGQPTVGATAAAVAAGTNYTSASAGAIGPQINAAGGDTLHLIGAEGSQTVAAVNLILYDRIWGAEPVVTTTTAQTCTETLARYATTGAAGLSKGNIVFLEVRATVAGAGAPTWAINYVDDSGDAPENTAAIACVNGSITPTFMYGTAAAPFIGIPLNAGDSGVSNVASSTVSASMASGSYAIVVGHPLMFIPGLAIANTGYIRDGINSAINLQRIYDSACLALIEATKPVTTANPVLGMLTLASG